MRAHLDNLQKTAIALEQNVPFGLAVGDERVYWTNYTDGTVRFAELSDIDP